MKCAKPLGPCDIIEEYLEKVEELEEELHIRYKEDGADTDMDFEDYCEWFIEEYPEYPCEHCPYIK